MTGVQFLARDECSRILTHVSKIRFDSVQSFETGSDTLYALNINISFCICRVLIGDESVIICRFFGSQNCYTR